MINFTIPKKSYHSALIRPIIFGAVCLLIISCATTPQQRVLRPWIRTSRSGDEIKIGSSIKIEVIGQAQPLLGNDELTGNQIRDQLATLLRRRGFGIDSIAYDEMMKFSYKTEKVNEFEIESSLQSFQGSANAMASGSAAGSLYGLGVSIAQAIAYNAYQSSNSLRQSIKKSSAFNHTISAEIYNRDNKLVWKGESTWNSNDPDILNRLTPTIRLILSSLPSDIALTPQVPEVEPSRANDYYNLELGNHWFSCPALPYRILFPTDPVEYSYESPPSYIIDNQNAMAAYLDLAISAEYALPQGDNNWDYPLDESLWKKVVLAGKYRLRSSGEICYAFISLSGLKEGYNVEKCWRGTIADYAKYESDLLRWQNSIRNYYNMYKEK